MRNSSEMARNQALFDQGPPPPCPPAFNIAAHTLDAGQPDDKTALVLAGKVVETFTFADLRAMVQGTMTGLSTHGIRPGDRVLLRIGHQLDFPILFFALAGLGACPVPTAPGLTKGEIEAVAARLAPVLTIAAPGLCAPDGPRLSVEAARHWRRLAPTAWANTRANDPAYVIFTSGTGGHAHGVVHAHRAAHARRMMWRGWYGLTPRDRVLHAGAFNWTYTLGAGLTDPWAMGATSVIYSGAAEPGIWADLMASQGISIFAAAPGVYRQVLNARQMRPGDAPALRHGLSAGEAMAPRLAAAWAEATGTPVLQALGMTECSTYASQSPESDAMRPQPGRRLAILADDAAHPIAPGTEGRIALSRRDPGLMLGYLDDSGAPHLPLEGEWFDTGDRGTLDADGTLTHLGRADDLVNAQGVRVSSAEVERVLVDHPDIAEAAVLALPVRADVEVLAAIVIPAPHAQVTEADVIAYCRTRLADYKLPRKICLADHFPRTATGKVTKHELARIFGWKEGT